MWEKLSAYKELWAADVQFLYDNKSLIIWKHSKFVQASCLCTEPLHLGPTLKPWRWTVCMWERQRKLKGQFWKFMITHLAVESSPMTSVSVRFVLWHGGIRLLACNSSTVSTLQHPACVIRFCVSLILALLFNIKLQIIDLCCFLSANLNRTRINFSRINAVEGTWIWLEHRTCGQMLSLWELFLPLNVRCRWRMGHSVQQLWELLASVQWWLMLQVWGPLSVLLKQRT